MSRPSPLPRARPSRAEGTRLSVGIILAHDFTLSAFALFTDHLRLAADEGDRSRPIRCHWSVMSDRPEPVRASCGVAVGRTSELVDPLSFDYIVVVGGLLQGRPQVGDATLDYLRGAARVGVKLIGICTGAFVLCQAGLMRDHTTCVSWYHSSDFQANFPDHDFVTDRMFLVDGDRITCAGGGGAADLASHLIEGRLGRAAAQKASHVLLLDGLTRGGTRLQPHLPMSDGEAAVRDSRVRRALLLMEQNLAEPVPIAAVAARLAISPRQLERLFQDALAMRPATYYRLLRLRHAHWLLEHADLSITEIATETGFADCAHFSRQFKTAFGCRPSDARLAPPGWSERAGVRVFEADDAGRQGLCP